MLDVKCNCGTCLSLPDDWAGKKGKCPTCGAVLNIAAPAVAAADMPPIQTASTATAPKPPAQPASEIPPQQVAGRSGRVAAQQIIAQPVSSLATAQARYSSSAQKSTSAKSSPLDLIRAHPVPVVGGGVAGLLL